MSFLSRKLSFGAMAVGLFAGPFSFAGPYEALEKIVGQAKDLSDFLSHPAWVSAYKSALQEYYGAPKFQCESFETVLAKVRQLNDKVPGFGAELWRVQDAPSLTYYRAAEDSNGPREKWELAEVPRKLHAVWNDPSRKGCTGDNCSKAEITAPERWASALPGSRTYLLHQDGRFRGAGALLMPVTKGPQVFSLMTLTGSEAMQTQEYFSATPSARAEVGTLRELFLEHLTGRVSVAPPVAVEYDRKNPSLARLIRLSPNRPADRIAGNLDEFQPADPMAARVAAVTPRLCFARKDSKGMGLLAGGGEGGASSSSGGSAPVDVGKLVVQMGSAGGEAAIAAVPAEQVPAVGQALSDLMKKGDSALNRQKAALALGLLDKLTPASETPAAVTRAPASTPASSGAPGRGAFLGAFQGALKDPDRGVRAIAAAALSDKGDDSPPVRAALKDALSGAAGGAGLPPVQLALLAAKAKNEPKGGAGPLTPTNIGALMNLAEQESDPVTRGKILDQVATSYVKSNNPEAARDALKAALPKDPKMRQELLDKVNNIDCGEPETGKKGKA